MNKKLLIEKLKRIDKYHYCLDSEIESMADEIIKDSQDSKEKEQPPKFPESRTIITSEKELKSKLKEINNNLLK